LRTLETTHHEHRIVRLQEISHFYTIFLETMASIISF